MQLMEMFKSAVNSVETQINTDIVTTSTEITVQDGATLPDAPNTLTIGGDLTNAETVMLIAKNGNNLTVQRAFQGVAQNWKAGTLIARYPTAYDHDTFIFNILTVVAGLLDHEAQAVASISGTHGIRYNNDNLQVFRDGIWVNVSGGSSAHLGVAILGAAYLGG